jgi:hypothetical protein
MIGGIKNVMELIILPPIIIFFERIIDSMSFLILETLAFSSFHSSHGTDIKSVAIAFILLRWAWIMWIHKDFMSSKAIHSGDSKECRSSQSLTMDHMLVA